MGKRIFDFSLALISLIVFSPLMVLVSLLIIRTSGGPVFYRGVRSGLHGEKFHILKFRTMVVNADMLGGPSTALNDPRLTKLGVGLRKFKLDELPQLINILKGDMSFVGPRPQVEKYTRLYNDTEKVILTVKPGLTDYASVKFINLDQMLGDENVDEKYLRDIEPEKNRLRVKYALEHNFFIDCKIIFFTILQMLRIRSVWNSDN